MIFIQENAFKMLSAKCQPFYELISPSAAYMGQ